MKRRQLGTGRVYRRKSRRTGKELPTWWLEYYVDGVQRRESSGTTDHKEAARLLKQRNGEVARGEIKPLALERLTVHDLLQLLMRDYQDKGRRVPAGHIEGLDAEFGRVLAKDLRRDRLDDAVRRWRREGITWPGRDPDRVRPVQNGTCNRYMATLRRAFSLAKEKLHVAYPLTFPHLPETARGQYIPPGDFEAIVNQLRSEVVRDLCRFAYLTGVRQGQLRATELANVDAERWVITWRPDQTKNGEPHVVPLVGEALDIVQRRWRSRRLDCRYLFHEDGRPIGKSLLRSAMQRACKAAGLPYGRKGGYVFHSTRNSAVTNLNGAGVPDTVAMTISGHRTANVFRRYSIRQESVQKKALEQMTDYLSTIAPTGSKVAKLPR
jgi:integrase